MKGVIQKIENKTAKTGVEYSIYTIDGEMFGVWKDWHKDFSVGDEIEYITETKGKYKNIIEAESVDKVGWKGPASIPTPISTPMPPIFKKGLYGADKEEDIHLQVCLKIASEQIKGKPEQIIEYAKRLMSLVWKP